MLRAKGVKMRHMMDTCEKKVRFKRAGISFRENFSIKTDYSLLYRSYIFRLNPSHHRSSKKKKKTLFRNCCDVDNGVSQIWYHPQIEALGLEMNVAN